MASDGLHVFVADRGAGAFVVVNEGKTIWTESHDVGPGCGALAADGRTWSTIVVDLDTETARMAVYRTPDTAAEPEPTPAASEPDELADTADDSADGDDDPAPDDDGSSDVGGASSDPDALEFVDYRILGERANEEYITLRNSGDSPLRMSGWTIRDRREVAEWASTPPHSNSRTGSRWHRIRL
ncbi:hypothetical protein [Natrinema sp. 1APR25-10V2]|uniref:hypothetical protein n=1 Tax=Natrinema sp. 1APR25-10V2 TaxID=2951081 RepID=UPI0028750B25|nr:hypothetical protein [Natrinema sp. 1APR25-10V2]MDS0477069.1 lamin tail domain-containing protein [Natrinema sp. 1APR25-10V2]